MRVVVASEDADELARCASGLGLLDDTSVEIVGSAAAARARVQDGDVSVLVIDGDLRPKGGYSLLYELTAQAELHGTRMPATVVLVERTEDRWLADWARADATVSKPVDPFALNTAVTALGGQTTS